MAVEAGTRVGRFVIHEYLGQGDLGLLFRARGPNAGSVAVKVLRSLSDAEVRARFQVLARRLGGIRHPNLVSVLDFGEHDDAPYLVLEHVPGDSLAELLRTSSVSQPAALWVLRGIAAGVDHAHHSGLVHGALKPQQVVLDGDDHPLVTDFGLTPLRWPRPDGVTVVVPERNAAYTAPEVVTGGQPTASADRYAYATIAYELLTGRTPFLGEPHDVMNAQIDAEPAVPSSVNPALTPDLDAVLLRGLAKDPRARWQSCTEMVEALAQAVSPAGPPLSVVEAATTPYSAWSGGSGSAAGRRAYGPEEPAAGGTRQRLARWSLVLGGALVAIALAVGGTMAWLASQPPIVAIVLSGTSVRLGEPFVVTATNLPPNQAGMIELHSDPEQIGTFRADRYGNVRVEVVVAQDAPPGDHTVTLCWEDGCHGSAPITIVDSGAPGSPAPQALPVAAPSTAVDPAGDAGLAGRGDGATGRTAGVGDPLPVPPSETPTQLPPQTPAPTPGPRRRRARPPAPTPSPTATPTPTPTEYPSPTPSPSAAGPLTP